MGWRSSLLGLAVLGGLGYLLYVSDSTGMEPDDSGALTESVLGGRSVLDAARIVVRPDPEALWIEFARDGAGAWRVVEPIRDLASAAVLDSLRVALDPARLLVAFEPAEVDERILQETGLDVPRAGVLVEWPDGTVVDLAVGLPSPYGEDLFARRVDGGDSGRIYRVHRAVRNALTFHPGDARERQVFRSDAGQAQSLRIVRRGLRPDGTDDVVALERRGNDWLLLEPAPLRVDQRQTATLVQALAGLRVDTFLPGKPSELSPVGPEKPPDVSLEIVGGFGREPVDLYFLNDKAAIVGFAGARDLWFSCEGRGYHQVVEVPIQAIRAQWLFQASLEDVSMLRIEGCEGPSFELERQPGGAFRLLRPLSWPADATAVSELVQGLRSVSVVEFAADGVDDFGPYGLGDGGLSLELQVGARRSSERILFGADTGEGSTFARRADEPHVVTVPRAAVDRVRRPFWTYVGRQILRIEDGGRVRQLVRALPDGSEVAFERGADGAWRRGGTGEKLPLVADTFDLLRDLRAAEIVPVAIADASPAGKLRIIAVSGQVLGELDLEATPDGLASCRMPGADAVRFVLSARDSRDVLALR
ncbi:MAG: DUF4340 domain-containing protein [Planctomycetota bacterium]|nr:DUF4340 domain-containing protein [Planctomycetota bacterium]MDA0934829.1 DUF4340 domain-containing protein [Planctomycetota bacterium]